MFPGLDVCNAQGTNSGQCLANYFALEFGAVGMGALCTLAVCPRSFSYFHGSALLCVFTGAGLFSKLRKPFIEGGTFIEDAVSNLAVSGGRDSGQLPYVACVAECVGLYAKKRRGGICVVLLMNRLHIITLN